MIQEQFSHAQNHIHKVAQIHNLAQVIYDSLTNINLNRIMTNVCTKVIQDKDCSIWAIHFLLPGLASMSNDRSMSPNKEKAIP